MNKHLRITFIVTFLGIFLNGCPLLTRNDVGERESQKQIQSQVSTIQQTRADQDNKLLGIQDELRDLNGRLSNLEHKAQDPKASAQGPTNQDLIDQMKIFETQIASLKLELEDLRNRQSVSATPAQTGNSVFVSKDLKGSSSEKGMDVWDSGETAFGKKDWKNAILSFQSYRDQNPKGKNYAVATYKIGVSFQELKMKDEARAFYEEVLQKFPKTPSAKKAKFRLGQLK